MEPGGIILLFSDGLSELFNEKRDMFGEQRITKCFLKHLNSLAREVVDQILTEADAWRGSRPQDDDITIIVIKEDI